MEKYMKNVKILPVKGKKYETGYINGKKLLLCLESAYHPNKEQITAKELKTLNQDNLDDLLVHGFDKRTYKNMSWAMEGRLIYDEEQVQFWDKVLFYNFIQCLPGKESSDNPTDEMFEEGIIPFKEVLEEYKPDIVGVFSKAVWSWLPNDMFLKDTVEVKSLSNYTDSTVYRISTSSNSYALSFGTRHPSGRYSWEKAHEDIKKILKLA
jgi:hypothetical protein